MPDLSILRPLLPQLPYIVGFLCLLLVVKFFKSPIVKGWLGEWQVRRGLKRLDPAVYRHFHDLYLPRPDGQGTTQIDHVVISPFGILVIETKNYRGWIFGTEKQREWTQQIYRRKSRFQNPLHQNQLHVRALSNFLGLPEERFFPVVFFVGNAEFKTPMPGNVINRGLTSWIKAHAVPLLDVATVQQAGRSLDHLSGNTDRRAAARNHLSAMKARGAG